MPHRKSWQEQCAAAVRIRDRLGLQNAISYSVSEKLIAFLWSAQRGPELGADLRAASRAFLTAGEIRDYLHRMPSRRTFIVGPTDRKLLRSALPS
jgi:hypothetical protein